MRQWESVTDQWRKYAMVRVQRSAGQCTSPPAQPSMWRSSPASLLETLVVKNCLLRSVELVVFLRKVQRSVMTRSSPLLLMHLRKCATWTHRKFASSLTSLCLDYHQNTSAQLSQKRLVSSSSPARGRWTSLCSQNGAWTQALQPLESLTKRIRLWLLHWVSSTGFEAEDFLKSFVWAFDSFLPCLSASMFCL